MKNDGFLFRCRVYLPMALCFVLCFLCMTCFRVVVADGPSMAPTYTPGDILLCARQIKEPKVGDVLLIRHQGQLVIKRVQFIAGQTPFLFTGGNDLHTGDLSDWLDGPIPEGYIFVAGDNPAESLDSRYESFGLVPLTEVEGTILWMLKDK